MVIILFDTLIEGEWNDVIDNYIKMGVGHIKIHKKGYDKNSERFPVTKSLLLYDSKDIEKKIREISGIKEIYPRLKIGGLISYEGKQIPILINGVNLPKERKFSAIRDKNVEGSIPENEEYKILIGKELSSILNSKVGDILLLYSRTTYETHNVIDLEISGIYSIGFSEFEKMNAFVPLQIIQDFIGAKAISELTIILEDPSKAEIFVDSLKNKLFSFDVEIFPYSHYIEEVISVQAIQKKAMGVIKGILLILAIFGISNMMMVSAWERKTEIGTLRAIGFGKCQISTLFLSEGFWIGFFGSLFGCFLGFVGSILLQNFGIPLPSGALEGLNIPIGTKMYGKIIPLSFLKAFFLGTLTTMIASLPSALRASNLPIIKTLREY